MLLHSGFGFFGVIIEVLILLSARRICFALWIENVLPSTCFAHCLGVSYSPSLAGQISLLWKRSKKKYNLFHPGANIIGPISETYVSYVHN